MTGSTMRDESSRVAVWVEFVVLTCVLAGLACNDRRETKVRSRKDHSRDAGKRIAPQPRLRPFSLERFFSEFLTVERVLVGPKAKRLLVSGVRAQTKSGAGAQAERAAVCGTEYAGKYYSSVAILNRSKRTRRLCGKIKQSERVVAYDGGNRFLLSNRSLDRSEGTELKLMDCTGAQLSLSLTPKTQLFDAKLCSKSGTVIALLSGDNAKRSSKQPYTFKVVTIEKSQSGQLAITGSAAVQARFKRWRVIKRKDRFFSFSCDPKGPLEYMVEPQLIHSSIACADTSSAFFVAVGSLYSVSWRSGSVQVKLLNRSVGHYAKQAIVEPSLLYDSRLQKLIYYGDDSEYVFVIDKEGRVDGRIQVKAPANRTGRAFCTPGLRACASTPTGREIVCTDRNGGLNTVDLVKMKSKLSYLVRTPKGKPVQRFEDLFHLGRGRLLAHSRGRIFSLDIPSTKIRFVRGCAKYPIDTLTKYY